MTDADAFGAYPKTVVLTDGSHLVLRLAVPADDEALAALTGHVPPDPPREPANDPGGAIGPTGAPRPVTVVACDGGRVVAAATLTGGAGASRPWVASLAVRIDPGYEGRRLGTWMLLDSVHLAAGLDVEAVVALAHPREGAYLAALRRLDFVDDATLRDRYALPDGHGRGLLALVKVVHREWTDF